jgi:hypothetical protein
VHKSTHSPYLIREITPYMLKRLRRVVSWGASGTFAHMNFYDVTRELRGQNVVMARPKSGKSAGSVPSAGNKGVETQWFNYRLTAEDTPVVLADCEDTQSLASRVAGLFASGADFSIRYVPERKNYSAFAIAMARSDDGVRVGVSAFGGTVWQAVAALLYKCDLYASQPEKLTPGGQNLGIG